MIKKTQTSRLVVTAFLVALEIILTRFFSINTPILRIGFGFVPISIMGALYGPIWAGLGYVAGDILGMLIFPSGMYFPGFTLTAFLTGMVWGIFLRGKEISWKTVLPASLIIAFVLNLGLDTLWLSMLYGDAFLALIPTRIIKCIVMVPIHIFLIPLIWNRVITRIPGIHSK